MGKEYNMNAREENISCHGLSFLCIYGKHVNGGFAALMNWGVVVELSTSKSDLAYNKKQIFDALEDSPDVGYLPSGTDDRHALARDLAMMIMSRFEAMPDIN